MEHALVERLDEMFRILVAIRRLGWYSRNLDEILSFGDDRSSRVDQHSDLVSPSDVLHSHEQQHPPLSAPNCHRGKDGPMNFTSYVPQEATRSRTPAVLLSACAPSPKGDGFGRRLKSAWSSAIRYSLALKLSSSWGTSPWSSMYLPSPHPSHCPSSPRSNHGPKGADPRTPCGSTESRASNDVTTCP